MRKPSDPIVARVPYAEWGHDELEGTITPYGPGVHRAAVQRRFANEVGVGFEEVRCVVRYARPLTYQEVWDERGRERWLDDWMEQNGVFYNLRRNQHTAHGRFIQVPDPPHEPPPDWQPAEEDPVFQIVTDPNGSYPTEVERVLVCEWV